MKLAASGIVSAMIDVSDGLSSDLSHLLEAGRVGAEIFAARIPLSREIRGQASRFGGALPDIALSGGEDYELLFTVPPKGARRLRSLGVDATEIGVITKEAGMVLVDARGGRRPLMAAGYDHFRGTARRMR
jgi:thiamine-monophosphate kinase